MSILAAKRIIKKKRLPGGDAGSRNTQVEGDRAWGLRFRRACLLKMRCSSAFDSSG